MSMTHQPRILTRGERASAFLGVFVRCNVNNNGSALPSIYAAFKAQDPLSGEIVYSPPTEDPVVKKLIAISEILRA